MIRTPRLCWFVLALAATIIPPTAADTFPMFSEGGIPAGTDIWT